MDGFFVRAFLPTMKNLAEADLSSSPAPDDPLQLVDQGDLAGVDLPPRLVQAEVPRPVDLGELLVTPRPWGPLDREGVAGDRRGIAVPLEGPDVDELAPPLPHRGQGEERAGRDDADLLPELPDGGGQRVLARPDLALGDRPGPLVLGAEERPAGVDEEDLQLAAGQAIHQESGAHSGLRHRWSPPGGGLRRRFMRLSPSPNPYLNAPQGAP